MYRDRQKLLISFSASSGVSKYKKSYLAPKMDTKNRGGKKFRRELKTETKN